MGGVCVRGRYEFSNHSAAVTCCVREDYLSHGMITPVCVTM